MPGHCCHTSEHPLPLTLLLTWVSDCASIAGELSVPGELFQQNMTILLEDGQSPCVNVTTQQTCQHALPIHLGATQNGFAT